MKNHLVIARYNENLEWLNYIDNKIYDIYIFTTKAIILN